ncbi:MAG: aminotransferase class V-fold PLP-dependent enzyme [Deltaproteobacteria bacterium]|nr:aminotransferase class V-fold PLP-dependent enzyme [Deltaproteobacteria bacterium]
MTSSVDALATRLLPSYSRFMAGAAGEVLLTGHSHQAWPDLAREAQLEAWDDAAHLADRKWSRIFDEILPRYRAQVALRIGSTRPADLAIAPNTHELVYRLLSCFPPNARVVTTDHEFHSLRRQLTRLEEDGLRVVRVPAGDGASLAARLAETIERERPALVAISAVLFTTSLWIALDELLETAARLGIPVLVDAYHAFNVVPLGVDRWPGQVFVTAGGYKYAQSGEGCCWMLLPRDATAYRPRTSGWFADFDGLEAPPSARVEYGAGGQRFLGATFDPTSYYRALRVMEWMDAQGLSVEILRAQSIRQTTILMERFDALGLADRGLRLASPRAHPSRGGFVAFEAPEARRWVGALAARRIRADARESYLRFGPAPYNTSAELERAMSALAEVAEEC